MKSFTFSLTSILALSSLVSAWQFSTFLNDDQICSTTAVLTVTDAPPGPCIALQGPVDSIEWLPYIGNGPFTGGNELDFYPSMDDCNADINASGLYGIYDTDEYNCVNDLAPTSIVNAYKVWDRSN